MSLTFIASWSVGLLPSIPPDGIPDIQTNTYNTHFNPPPVNPSGQNEENTLNSDEAFNRGKWDAESM